MLKKTTMPAVTDIEANLALVSMFLSPTYQMSENTRWLYLP
jgi:hypothetical protein